MKLINRKEEIIKREYFTIEFEKNQLLTIIMALGQTTPQERKSDANNFYDVENFVDDEDLLDSLVDVVKLTEKSSRKKPKPQEIITRNY